MYRKLIFTLCFGLMGPFLFAQSGLVFFQGSLQEALAHADSIDKPIFIDTYADWCGPCKLMEREVFPDSSVGAFFNKSFVNIKVDVDTREGNQFAQRYDIDFIPRLMFIRPDGTILHQKEGFFSPRLFLRMGQRALKKAAQ